MVQLSVRSRPCSYLSARKRNLCSWMGVRWSSAASRLTTALGSQGKSVIVRGRGPAGAKTMMRVCLVEASCRTCGCYSADRPIDEALLARVLAKVEARHSGTGRALWASFFVRAAVIAEGVAQWRDRRARFGLFAARESSIQNSQPRRHSPFGTDQEVT